jgi:hypothetical protein
LRSFDDLARAHGHRRDFSFKVKPKPVSKTGAERVLPPSRRAPDEQGQGLKSKNGYD